MSAVRIKVCCIASIEEARIALRYGVSAIGLVSAMPSGPGPIPEDRIAEIARVVPEGTDTFLLTSLTDPKAIAAQHARCGTTTIQIVDRLRLDALKGLRDSLPHVNLVQVIHVIDERSVDEAVACAPFVDALLLDSGRPDAKVKVLGGTGLVHDWSLSRQIVERAGRPVWLAGGLKPENVAEAIAQVRPYGVDVCSGLRTIGALDEEKLKRFVAAVRSAGSSSAG
jgi:phosphoribosylanthranilate isomerase